MCSIDDNMDALEHSDADDMEIESESVNRELQQILLDNDDSHSNSQSSSRPTSNHNLLQDVIDRFMNVYIVFKTSPASKFPECALHVEYSKFNDCAATPIFCMLYALSVKMA